MKPKKHVVLGTGSDQTEKMPVGGEVRPHGVSTLWPSPMNQEQRECERVYACIYFHTFFGAGAGENYYLLNIQNFKANSGGLFSVLYGSHDLRTAQEAAESMEDFAIPALLAGDENHIKKGDPVKQVEDSGRA